MHALGDEAAQQTRQKITAAALCHAGIAGRVDVDRAAFRSGNDRVRALEHERHAVLCREGRSSPDTVLLHRVNGRP